MSIQYVRYPASSVTSSSAAVGVIGSPGPLSADQVGARDGSGNLQYLTVDASKNLNVNVKAGSISVLANTNGSNTESTVSTVKTETVPANAVGFILMNEDISTLNIRWKIGSAASAASGQQLQPGRDTGYVPCAANISICAESGTQNYNLQWILSQ